MKTRTRVPLIRRFAPVPDSPTESDEQQFEAGFNYGSPLTWEDIDKGYRSVVLAEAGAGKTFEMQARAKYVETKGDYAFFIRIEDIENDFEQSFEVGNADSFQQWLVAPSDAWFYLDSVDEARLESPTAFRKAIRRFSREIKNAQPRAHVCISSRPYAWRPHSDRQLIEQYLPLPERQVEATGSVQQATDTSKPQVALKVFLLQPLEEADIRQFAQHRSADDIDRLIDDLNRKDLMDIAGRPFDLEGILDRWRSDQTLGDSRRELLHHNVRMRLQESHDPDRAVRQPLNLAKAQEGAERIAAAVVLTGKADIHVPDGVHTRPGIDAKAVLPDWKSTDVQALLETAIFGGVIYGAVRFRNREVREILAAGWFSKLLQRGHPRHEIKSLFFRTQYGHHFVSPRLRVLLPWLILEDGEFRRRILTDHPEIAMEGGDPAGLPLPTREKILSDVVERLVRHEDCGMAGDNSALARIAHADLTEHARALIDRYPDDEALFFLGRLVWQGAMSGCVSRLSDVAADPGHDTYTRIAATRAVTTCGTAEQRDALWDALLASDEDIPREILADLVRGANDNDIPKVLQSIDRLPPDSRFSLTSVKSALSDLAGRLALPSAGDVHGPFAVFIRGLHDFLHRHPFIRPGYCDISEQFSWLLGPTTHALKRLVAARSEVAFDEHVMALLRNAPTARRQLVRVTELRANGLSELVADWPELNDALFWYSARATRAERGRRGLGLNDDWPLQRLDHYWAFGPDSFPRILDEVRTRELEDDRAIALSLAFRVYRAADEPVEWWDELQACVSGNETLSAVLDRLVTPEGSEDVAAAEREWTEEQEEREREEREAAKNRASWIAHLKANPDIVRSPRGLHPGQFSTDQYWLLREVEGDDVREERGKGSEWRRLIDEFGEDVAQAYRDAAAAHWRHFRPELRSEGGNTRSFPYSLVFAMAGLAIEAAEDDAFPQNLSPSEVRRALRYMVFELNGFPKWLESMYREWPSEVLDAILTELLWELENTDPDKPMHYILHDLAVYAPWLHGALTGPLLCWIQSHDLPSDAALDYSFRILRCGALDPSDLVAVATSKATDESSDQRAYWYAVWVDVDPETGVDALVAYLNGLDADEGSRAAQLFITTLMGSSRGRRATGPNFGNFHTPGYLKSLYLLMHRHIRVTEDIDRSSGGVYSPGLRDEAQTAREGLLNLLVEIPGNAAYVALSELVEEHPDPRARPFVETRARRRAEQDGDLEQWTAEQVAEFGEKLTRIPRTHRQQTSTARAPDASSHPSLGRPPTTMSYEYTFDATNIGDLHLRRSAYGTLHEAERELRDALQEWNRRVLDNGARTGPFEREVADLNRMLAWGDEQLADTQSTHITVTGISLSSARYAKAGLVLMSRRRREDSARKVSQGWPATALRMLDGVIEETDRIAAMIDADPSDVLWEIIPRDDASPPSTTGGSHPEWDVFICHASEDKDGFVRDLAKALQARGLKVWFDESTLTVGDSLRRSIDHGLARSRFGVVVISPHFLDKEWPQKELDGLFAREIGGAKVILPVWHNISAERIRSCSPMLADRLATRSSDGLHRVVEDLVAAAPPRGHARPGS